MPRSPNAAALIDARRARLVSLLALPLSYDEIADTMNVARHVIGNDIAQLRRSNTMPERHADTSYSEKLYLYRHALADNNFTEKHSMIALTDDEKKGVLKTLRNSLDLRDVVKRVNLMLKGIAMTRTPKLRPELRRTAIIWQLAMHASRNNGVDDSYWWSRLQPSPHAATFTVESFENYVRRCHAHKILVAKNAEELAERFVAHLEFRTHPSDGTLMIPGEAWSESMVRADLVITETTRDLIEKILHEDDGLDDKHVNMLAALVDDGMTLEEIGKEFGVTRERVRQNIAKTLRVIRTGLRKEFGLDERQRGINITDTAALLRKQELEELNRLYAVAQARLAERTTALVNAGLLAPEDAQKDDIAVIGEETFVHLCRRVDSFDFSVRSANSLQNGGLEFIWQIAEKTEAEMLKTKNFGRKSLNEIKETLEELGLSLGMIIPHSIRVRLPRE